MSTQKYYSHYIVISGIVIFLLFILQTKFIFGQDLQLKHFIIPLVLTVLSAVLLTKLKSSYSRLEKLVGTDPLTGLCNRRSLENNISMCIENYKRYGVKFSVLMFDIDNFKNINDTYGHQQGDSILVEISDILKASSRITDCCARWGGEEFIILLPNSDINGALTKAENLRALIESKVSSPSRITCSFGVSDFYKGDDSIDNIIMRADQALYQAKYMGKNRVEFMDAA